VTKRKGVHLNKIREVENKNTPQGRERAGQKVESRLFNLPRVRGRSDVTGKLGKTVKTKRRNN